MHLLPFSHSWLFATPWTAAHQASLSFTISQSLLKLMSIESVMPSNHLVLSHPFLLPSIFPSIRVFFNESAPHIRWPKHWSLSFSPSNEYSGLISFRIDWFNLRAVQGTLKSLQHHSSKASILQRSATFMVQLSQVVNFLTKILPLWSTLVFIMHNIICDHPVSNCGYKNGHLVINYNIETLTSTVWKFLNTKKKDFRYSAKVPS